MVIEGLGFEANPFTKSRDGELPVPVTFPLAFRSLGFRDRVV